LFKVSPLKDKNSFSMPQQKRIGSEKSSLSRGKPRVVRDAQKKKLIKRISRPQPIRRRSRAKDIIPARSLKLSSFHKHESNPIIEPRQDRVWEMKATFNPAAMQVGGRVHLLYRAIGGNDMSVLGYAASDDGVTIRERSERPAFEHWTTKKKTAEAPVIPPDFTYCSGGGWNGGSEDPRLTVIDEDGRAYLTYTAFDGWGSVRIALSSIGVDDFLHQRWNWSEPVLISPPGQIHKNWALFPEKINGKYAILHGVTPDILVEYVDSLDFDETKFINSSRPTNDKVEFRPGVWDSRVRGVGPPPIKTREGWLLLYHAVDARDPNRYKLGAMILDANDPTKILYRSQVPVLEPEEWYENNGWKSGVIYSCGAVVKDGELYVYYGGADSVVCVAIANLDRFLCELKKQGVPKLIKKDAVPKRIR
jgi:predicted GH43/DUF377 family glycosyl hydrolase